MQDLWQLIAIALRASPSAGTAAAIANWSEFQFGTARTSVRTRWPPRRVHCFNALAQLSADLSNRIGSV